MRPALSVLILTLLFAGLKGQTQPASHDSLNVDSLKRTLVLPVDRYTDIDYYGKNGKPTCLYCYGIMRLTFQSDSIMTVKSITTGKVISVFELDSVFAVLASIKGYFFTYYNLTTVLVKRGDFLSPGQPIGKIADKSHNDLFELEFFILDNKSRNIDPYPWFFTPTNLTTSL